MILELLKILGSRNWNCTCTHAFAHELQTSHESHKAAMSGEIDSYKEREVLGPECRAHLLQ